MKKNGRTIKHWQLHTLSDKWNTKGTLGVILTGTIAEDPTGKWEPGMHMRSSLLVSFEPSTSTVETLNSIYKLEGPEGEKVLPKGDLGDFVLGIFY